jgi:hypothetical protein
METDMNAEARNIKIQFRVGEYDHDLLSGEAKKRKLSLGQTARVMLHEALSGFDQKQEYLMRRIDLLNDKLDERFGLLIDISSLGAAAGALPFAAKEQELEVEANREAIKKHFAASRTLGKTLVESIKSGKL